MPNIARTTPRSMPVKAQAPGAKTKILLVRQPVKSVRKSDEPNRDALRLAYGVVIGVGSLAALWLMGYLGFRLGFAPAVRVPDLLVEGAGGLAAGVMMLISLPGTMTNRSSRTGPALIPPRLMTIERSARSFMSMVRGQVILRGSMLSALP